MCAAHAAPAAPEATEAPKAAAPAAATVAVAADKVGGTVVTTLGTNVSDTLNQHLSNNTQSRMVAKHVLDTLIQVNPKDGSPTPHLAKSWEISPDGKVYTFKLREDVKFHDGTQFTAEAVKWNLDYTARPDLKHGFAWAAIGGEKYEKTEVVDRFTAKVYFKSPSPAFLLNLSDGGLGIDSPEAMQKAGDEYGKTVLVGSGPFKFKEWVRGDHVTLVPNPDYNWAPALMGRNGPPYLNELIYRDVKDYDTMANAVEVGEIHVARLNEATAARLVGKKGIATISVPKAGTSRMFVLNMNLEPTKDVKVRQAIAYAMDRKGMLQLPFLSGYGVAGLAPLPRNLMPPAQIATLEAAAYPYDDAKAKALLDEAGWKVGSDGIREKDGKKLELYFPTYTLAETEAAQAMLAKVGISVKIGQGDFNWYYAEMAKKTFHIAIESDSGFDPVRLLTYFYNSKSPSNNAGYSGADAELNAAANALSLDEMWKNLIAAQVKILKDPVSVPAYDQVYPYVINDKVKDVFFHEVAFPYFYNAWVVK